MSARKSITTDSSLELSKDSNDLQSDANEDESRSDEFVDVIHRKTETDVLSTHELDMLEDDIEYMDDANKIKIQTFWTMCCSVLFVFICMYIFSEESSAGSWLGLLSCPIFLVIPVIVIRHDLISEKTNKVNSTNQHDNDTLSSAEEMEYLVDDADKTKIAKTTNANEMSITLQYENTEEPACLDGLQYEPTVTEDSNVIVVAIDFGTTYSGWAFSLLDRFQDNKLKIQGNGGWESGDGLVTLKVPTCILFDKNEHFHSFGYEAERIYAELTDENSGDDWSYFSRFKMSLFSDEGGIHSSQIGIRTISRNFKIKDVNGRRMSAMKVFAESLKFLKNNFLEILKIRIPSIPLHYISWVLTVPAIWNDKAKQFMRLAALEAGIPGTQLTLAYEPEAAALCCRESAHQGTGHLAGSKSSFGTGQSLLILDCGGGTVDVTAYEIMKNGRLKELHEPTGGPWGGTMVDQAFMKFMEDIFGTKVWTKFKHENRSEFLDIQRHFELKKRTIGKNSARKEIHFQISRSLFDTYAKIHSKEFISEKGVTKHKDKLKIPREKIVSLFKESTDAIVDHIQVLLQKPGLEKIKTILLVGGYSDSALLRYKVIEKFSKMIVMCPDDAILSVVKGAVIFGNTPELIQERVSPRTYGIACNLPFDPDKHLDALLEYNDNRAFCRNIFKVLVRKGDSVTIGKNDFETIFHPTRASDTTATVGVYTSTEQDPTYTFGFYVQELGVLKLDMSDIKKGKEREIKVCFIFKPTEFTVVAKEGNNIVSQKFNCLG